MVNDEHRLRARAAPEHERRAREKRRAVALRDNLRRRKAQLRARGNGEAGESERLES